MASARNPASIVPTCGILTLPSWFHPDPSFGYFFFCSAFVSSSEKKHTRFPDLFYGFETFFNTMFFFELLVNMYAFWCCRFWKSGLGALQPYQWDVFFWWIWKCEALDDAKSLVSDQENTTCYLGFIAKYAGKSAFEAGFW